MGTKGVHRDSLADDVPDRVDRAVLEHVEDALNLGIDPVAGIGRNEVVAARDRVQNRRGRGTAKFDTAGCQGKE
jgi:hypothetical protein